MGIKFFLYLVIFCVALIIFTGCSSDPPPVNSSLNNNEVTDSMVLKIPTPREQTSESEAIYTYPNNQQITENPANLKPVFRVIDLKHITAKRASEMLQKIMPECIISEGERSNMLLLKGRPQDIYEAEHVIDQIDRPVAQIMIESKVVEVSESGLKSIGVTWGNTAGNLKISLNKSDNKIESENISAVINALITSGKASLLANPKISTLDNSEANVNIGSKIPYAVPVSNSSSTTQWAIQYIDAGVSLKITPHICKDGLISVQIRPEVSSISEWRTTPAGEFPVISTRNADAFVQVKNGETIVIGGLINETDRENITKIPVVGEIPLIKELFSKRSVEKNKTEIVFLITPKIM